MKKLCHHPKGLAVPSLLRHQQRLIATVNICTRNNETSEAMVVLALRAEMLLLGEARLHTFMKNAGRILNRFSSDTSTADDSLPFIANILLANIVSLLGILVILAYSQPLLLLVFIPLYLGYIWMQVGIAH